MDYIERLFVPICGLDRRSIYFTIDEIKGSVGYAEKKAVKLLDELGRKYDLLERKRQGLGKPNLIYVKNFVDSPVNNPVERQLLNCRFLALFCGRNRV